MWADEILTYDVFITVPVTLQIQLSPRTTDPERAAERAAEQTMDGMLETPSMMCGHITINTVASVSLAEVAKWGAMVGRDPDATLRGSYYAFKSNDELGITDDDHDKPMGGKFFKFENKED